MVIVMTISVLTGILVSVFMARDRFLVILSRPGVIDHDDEAKAVAGTIHVALINSKTIMTQLLILLPGITMYPIHVGSIPYQDNLPTSSRRHN